MCTLAHLAGHTHRKRADTWPAKDRSTATQKVTDMHVFIGALGRDHGWHRAPRTGAARRRIEGDV